MRAIKFWSEASLEERQRNGNPPTDWIKESVYFSDQSAIPYFESLGYQIMSDQQFDEYVIANQSSFNAYLESGYREVSDFNKLFHENELKIVKGKEFLLRFKLKNIAEGITWPQAVWLHHRVKNWIVTVNGIGDFAIDLYNVINSGDLESAIYMIASGQADDMTQSYHWITEQRKNWAIQELQKILQSL